MRIVTTHKNTDFDALASVIAATVIYPDAIPVLPKPINPNVKEFLSIHKDLLKVRTWQEIDHREASGLIIVDAGSWDRLSVPGDVQTRTDLEIILFDHHPQEGDIEAGQCCREQVGATITLMLRRLKRKHPTLSAIQSTLFLAGLYEDTGNLSFPTTTPEDIRAAAYLLEHKADLTLLNYILRPAYGPKQKNILFDMLKTAQRTKINGNKIGFSKIVIDGFVENLAVVVHMYREIMNVDAAFGLFFDEVRSTCVIIARSSSDKVNVGEMMRNMGGGGHPGAGSALVKQKSLDEVEEWIRLLLMGTPRSLIQVSDIMSFPVLTVNDRAPMEEAANLLRGKGCTGLPVVNDTGNIVGVISRRDFQKKIKRESQLKAPVKAYMSTDVVTIQSDKSPADASGLMIKHDIGRLPVIENDRIIGIVTRTDVMHYWYDLMPR